MTTVEAVRAALRDVVDPCTAATGSHLDVVEMGLVEAVAVDDGAVTVHLRLTTPACHMVPYFVEEIEGRVGDLDGIVAVDVETDDGMSWTEDMMTAAARRKRRRVLDGHAAGESGPGASD